MVGQKNRRIAFVTHKLDAYSETFIRLQIDRLVPDIILHDGLMPSKINNEPIIKPIWKRVNFIFNKIFRSELVTLEMSISSLLRKKKVDLVLVQYGPAGVSMLPICKRIGIPLVVHFHGFDASHKPTLQKYETAYLEMFNYAKYIVVVSKSMFEAIKAMGCPKDKIVLNTYGVNEIFFSVSPLRKSDIFLAVGRFVEKKGPEFTIKAFHRVYRQFPDAKLFMVGDGPLRESCKDLVSELALEKNVFFPGVLTPDLIAAFMQRSLAFVQHSIVADSGDSEGTPVSIMEASASALPVVSTYHAGIPDVIQDGITGFLVKERDIENMADAMLVLIKDKELAEKMGLAGRERIKSVFSTERYIEVLKSLLY